MKKLHFATRVIVKMIPKANSNSFTSNLKKRLQKEINADKVSINKSVFVKSQDEKDKLKIAKAEWKKHRDDILKKS